MHLEDELKKALRAEDPGAAFTQRVLARAREERMGVRANASEAAGADVAARVVAANTNTAADAVAAAAASSVNVATPGASRAARTTRWVAAAIAASLTIAAAGTQLIQHQQNAAEQRRYIAEGERARAQVLTALRITSEKLNIVHDKVVATREPR